MTDLRTWKALIRKPTAWLTANNEATVSRSQRYARAEKVRAWRRATVEELRRKDFPTGITPVSIYLKFFYAGHRPVRDRLNLSPTVKAIVDGLCPPRTFTRDGETYTVIGYGFLPDDSDIHVESTTWDLVKTSGFGVGLHITETSSTKQLPLFDPTTNRRG